MAHLTPIIMSSRVLYGLSREGWLPQLFSQVSKKWHTPVVATVLVSAIMFIAALSLDLSTLAQITSFLLLIIFSVVQLAALKLIKSNGLKLSRFVPIVGIITNVGIIVVQSLRWFDLI